jgi:hypothetical protein
MRTLTATTGLAFILTLFLTADSLAHRGMRWKGSGGWGPKSVYNRMYDPKTVETMRGIVVSVDTMTFRPGMSYGIHLVMKTDKETISVHLGPGWYIQNQDVRIAPKDAIQVRGSRISFDSAPALIAAEVQKGDEILKLRDDRGFPVWSGWRRGSSRASRP